MDGELSSFQEDTTLRIAMRQTDYQRQVEREGLGMRLPVPLFLRNRKTEPWLHQYDPRASRDDILNCFRLLLGRYPHREEWRGHSMRIGEDLAGVVASYLSSLEFANRDLLQRSTATAPVLTGLLDFSIYSDPADAVIGRFVREDNYERDVTAVFRSILRPGMGVLDLGANIGYFTLLAAAIVGADGFVIAVEPNGDNARLLEASRHANRFDWVTIAQVAAGREISLLALHTSFSNGTTSAIGDDPERLFGSTTVACLRADLLVPAGRRIDLIKVDVEGAEYNALLGCTNVISRDRPTIVSEFSPDMMPGISGIDGPGYLRWLLAQDYRLAIIAADGSLTKVDRCWEEVMTAYEARGSDHIDIVAIPAGRQS